ncbi:MAG: coproporphyrinogen dehydrogenase HemZ [Lachnospiraceae bacterium]|nr:coproporphyrinogen dehydrogenase HemZ [Lachnospiraceae bacterium]
MEYYIIHSNSDSYIYDIHALFSAFYPGVEVKVLTPSSAVVKNREIQKAKTRATLFFDPSFVECAFEEEEEKGTPAKTYHWECSGVPEAAFKNGLKRFLYDSLSERTGKKLPWGDLTGIRPTKIAMTMLADGKGEDEIRNFLQGAHAVTTEKTELSIDIAKREGALIRDIEKKVQEGKPCYSLYLGVAFCPTTCLYCSFPSYPVAVYKDRLDAYVDRLLRECEQAVSFYPGITPDTIYIGGGTPTSLSAEQLKRLTDGIASLVDVSKLKEYTVEAGRPDSVSTDKFKVLKEARVTRISINPQTMKQQTLDIIGRLHTVEDTVKAFEAAREAGFDNINMDTILGLPGETPADVEKTFRRIEELAPDSVTVHSLAVKKGSRLSDRIREQSIEMPSADQMGESMEIASAAMKRMGLDPYYLYRQKHMTGNLENVGYAKSGKEGLYNILIMEEVESIVACGAGTISKRVFPGGRIERCENVKEISEYLTRLDEMMERKAKLFINCR